MAKRVATHHKGAPRRYFCHEAFDSAGKLHVQVGCDHMVVNDGQPIPLCATHKVPMLKPRFKRVEDRRMEVISKTKAVVGIIHMWPDVARRKSKCHLCFGIIEPGEDRIAFDYAPRHAGVAPRGGIITRMRNYVHSSCLIDTLYGGEAGEGCPGCSAKILHDEFMSIREMLEKRNA